MERPYTLPLALPQGLAGLSAVLRTESLEQLPSTAVLGSIDDRTTADQAVRRASAGELLLYTGDYHNARQLLAAMSRRLRRGRFPVLRTAREAFEAERRLKAREHGALGRILVAVTPDGRVAAGRAPDVAEIVRTVLGSSHGLVLLPLTELLGMIGAAQWAKKGVPVVGLPGPIAPGYGVFAPTRSEPAALAAQIPEVAEKSVLDCGTGTGVLAFVFLGRGARRAVGVDRDPRAVACALDNANRLGLSDRFEARGGDVFCAGRFDLVVANPPWLPVVAHTRLDQAVYDSNGRFLTEFFAGLRDHLTPTGRGYLILSDLAERLELRAPGELAAGAASAELSLRELASVAPRHPKAAAAEGDPLQRARAAERTALYELEALH